MQVILADLLLLICVLIDFQKGSSFSIVFPYVLAVSRFAIGASTLLVVQFLLRVFYAPTHACCYKFSFFFFDSQSHFDVAILRHLWRNEE